MLNLSSSYACFKKISNSDDIGTQMPLNVCDTGECIFYLKYLRNRNTACHNCYKLLNLVQP